MLAVDEVPPRRNCKDPPHGDSPDKGPIHPAFSPKTLFASKLPTLEKFA